MQIGQYLLLPERDDRYELDGDHRILFLTA